MRYYPGDVHRSMLDVENSRLHGTGRVADDLYLIAHREINGRPYLSRRVAGIALAGALLAELLAAKTPAVTLDHGRIFPLYRENGAPVARYARPSEPVEAQVLDLLVAEPQPRPVRDWLLFLGKSSAAQVAERLQRAGYLTRPANRLSWRTHRPVPIENDWSACALLRAHAALNLTRTLTPYCALLTGLTLASGLGFRFTDFSSGPGRGAEEAVRVLSLPLQNLIVHVQAAADAALLSART